MVSKALAVATFTLFSIILALTNVNAYVIDFEGLADLTPVTNQYSSLGLTFSGATILTSGAVGGSLNELEFPPNSGTNVVYDDGGPINIYFTGPVTSAGGYFTNAAPLTLSFFDTFSNLIGNFTTPWSSNLALSGDPGTIPNFRYIFQLTPGSPVAIGRMTIAADPNGSSFTMDDFTATPVGLPEPSTLFLLGSALAGMAGLRLLRR